MTLLIDIGNTRVKFALWDGENLTPISAMPSDMDDIDNVLISCVGPEHPEIEAAIKDKQIRRLTWQTPEARNIITNMPLGLGSDRIANDIGAINSPEVIIDNDDDVLPMDEKAVHVLVIDAGTCVTFDVLSVREERIDGEVVRVAEIIGGSISPGITLRLESMHEHTRALPLITQEGSTPLLGTDTETAMRSGAVLGMRYEIEGYIRAIREKIPDIKIFMTGGNGITEPDVTVDPYLMFKGLLKTYNP